MSEILSEEEIDALLAAVSSAKPYLGLDKKNESCFFDEERNQTIYCSKFIKDQLQDKFYSYCPHCGFHFEHKPEPDLWLIPGWPYEVWNSEKDIRIMYFSNSFDGEKPLFLLKKDEVSGYSFLHYCQIGTPLDFAPDWATHIEFANHKLVCNEGNAFRFKQIVEGMWTRSGEWLPWHNCPEQLKDKTLPIPDFTNMGVRRGKKIEKR